MCVVCVLNSHTHSYTTRSKKKERSSYIYRFLPYGKHAIILPGHGVEFFFAIDSTTCSTVWVKGENKVTYAPYRGSGPGHLEGMMMTFPEISGNCYPF